MIHCDEVFDILTRGPFPTGAASDGIVESHLAHCETCRRLAEALRPAIEMFQEAVAPEESRNLPSYWGEASSYPAPWRDEASADRGASLQSSDGGATLQASAASGLRDFNGNLANLLRFSGAVCLGVLVAAAILRMGSWASPFSSQANQSGQATQSDPATQTGRDLSDSTPAVDELAQASMPTLAIAGKIRPGGMKLLASLPMSLACFDPPFTPPAAAPQAAGNAAAMDLADQKCCTCCHSYAGRRDLTKASTLQVVKACGICH